MHNACPMYFAIQFVQHAVTANYCPVAYPAFCVLDILS